MFIAEEGEKRAQDPAPVGQVYSDLFRTLHHTFVGVTCGVRDEGRGCDIHVLIIFIMIKQVLP